MVVVEWAAQVVDVRLLLGEGEDAGRVRVVPGGAIRLLAMGKTRAFIRSGLLACTLPVPDGKVAPVPVEFDYDAEWIDITLPVWARAKPAMASTPVTVVGVAGASAPAKPPFKGALAGGLGDVAGRPSAPLPMTGGARRG